MQRLTLNQNNCIYLILDNIRSMENVGSIFRTADATGISKLYLCGLTPKPPRKEIDKAALGAVDFVDWEYQEDTLPLLIDLREKGFFIIAIEQDNRSIPYSSFRFSDMSKLAIVVGSETNGIGRNILDFSDQILELPMKGKKNSLNVAVATGIALYSILNTIENN